jgi:biopolymer transport protein ExbD
MQFRSKPPRRVTINITSLIDVIFMLLMFFVVTSSFLEKPGIKLELPSAKSSETVRVEKFVLYISADGGFSLNEEAVPADELQTRIASALPSMADGTLTLYADQHAQHGAVVRAMDAARLAGVKKLVVATTDIAKQ